MCPVLVRGKGAIRQKTADQIVQEAEKIGIKDDERAAARSAAGLASQ